MLFGDSDRQPVDGITIPPGTPGVGKFVAVAVVLNSVRRSPDFAALEEDLECLKQIHLLVKEQGLTLEGAAKKIAADRKAVEGRVKALDSLKEIRRQLVEVKKSL